MSAATGEGAAARWVHYFSDPPPEGCSDLNALLRGKGASLKELTRAGLPVPPGFTISCDCCACLSTHGGQWPDGLEAELRTNVRRLEQQTGLTLGCGERPLLLAVRSGGPVSMPGMMDTLLNIGQPPADAWRQLVDAIDRVAASWHSERAKAYRQHHKIEDLPGTAVTVQAMFPAEVAGVLFTCDPLGVHPECLVIEAARGLGHRVVSGSITPDRFLVCRRDLVCIERSLSGAACLDDEQIVDLARLALEVEAHYGEPVDLEWGLADGRFALLQARPIRAAPAASDETETIRREEIQRLELLAAGGRKLWVLHNLAETLPAPTPLTWDIVRRFMLGDGGFGRLYQSLGYRPSRRVCAEGFLELIGGRIYADPDRLAELFWDGLPLAYDLDALCRDPSRWDDAPLHLDPDRATGRCLYTLPLNLWSMWRVQRHIAHGSRAARGRFEEQLTAWQHHVEQESRRSLDALSDAALIVLLRERMAHVLDRFGPESLRPGFFGGLAFDRLRTTLARFLGTEEGHELAEALSLGPEKDAALAREVLLERVAAGEAPLEEFLDRYGHRAAGEMELAQPRWREEPAALQQQIEHLRRAGPQAARQRHDRNIARRREAEATLPQRLRAAGCSSLREQIEADAALARELLPYREIGKHHLMLGYELLRQATEALARRWELGRGLYFLTLDELPHFTRDRARFLELVAKRRLRWEGQQKIFWPPVIDSRRLDDIGRVAAPPFEQQFQGQPMAGGVATGEAVIVVDPHAPPLMPSEYVLVCPSADPGWMPLLIGARGLVVQRGGVLSHAAIVARELGIPAVACASATTVLRPGDRVRVDGHTGCVQVLKRGDRL